MVPSESMSPSILAGDRVLTCKISYGPRIISLKKFIGSKEIRFVRIKGMLEVRKDDILVFNYPQYEYLADSITLIYGTPFIKRCYRVAGDSVRIDRTVLGRIDINTYDNLFPYDSALHWNSERYGPLYVPKKGETIQLTRSNIKHYRDVLLYENTGIQFRHDSVYLNGALTCQYTFKYNYYFMLGDNYYQSRDSRFWGFLPETHIIGKASTILFSLDPGKPWYHKFRWNRFLKKIV
jgi:signal peptidase I